MILLWLLFGALDTAAPQSLAPSVSDAPFAITTKPQLTSQLTEKELGFEVRYDPQWDILPSPNGNGITINIGRFHGHFGISVNAEGVGIPTIAYYSIIEGRALRPYQNAMLLGRVCAIRDDSTVYIQRDNIVYTLSLWIDDNTNNPNSQLVNLKSMFDSFIGSFQFTSPWSPTHIPEPNPPIPTPCWR